MSAIISEWITMETGEDDPIIINKQLSPRLRNGVLIANILYKHDIITKADFSWIFDEDDEETIKTNFGLVRNWLKFISISLSDEEYKNLIDGVPETCLGLLFQIYLKLVNTFLTLNFQTELNKKQQKIYAENNRFTKTKRNEDEQKEDDIIVPESNQYCYMNLLERHKVAFDRENRISSWYKLKNISVQSKLKEIAKKCRERMDKLYEKYITCEPVHVLKDGVSTVRISKPIYHKIKDKKIGKEVRKIKENVIIRSESALLSSRLMRELIMVLCDDLKRSQENEFETFITKKSMKMSMYEKQMLQKLYEVYNMKYVIFANREQFIKSVMKREIEITQLYEINAKTKMLVRYDIYNTEMNRIRDLYLKLNAERESIYRQRLTNFCTAILDDLIEMSIRLVEFRENNEFEASVKRKLYWKLCFTAGKMYDNYIDDLFKLTYYEDAEETDMEVKEAMRLELDKQLSISRVLINGFSLDSNLEFYKLAPEDLKDNEEIIRKTDTIIYKLLSRFKLSKYPIDTLTKPNLPEFKFRTCLIGLTDLTILPILKTMLQDENIIIIEMKDVIIHCMDNYVEEDPHFVVKNDADKINEETFKWIIENKKNPVFKDADKKWKLLDYIQAQCNTFPSSNKNKQKDNSAQLNVNDEDMLELSNVAKLGKLAYQYLFLGSQIPNKYLVQMFLEYLKTLKDCSGWILINYPETFEQLILLEETLTGIKYNVELKEDSTVEDIVDTEIRELNVMAQENKEKRKILLFPVVKDIVPDPYYESHMTSVIMMQPFKSSRLAEVVELASDYEALDDLQEFYSSKGILHVFQYKTLSFNVVENLSKVLKSPNARPFDTVTLQSKYDQEEILNEELSDLLIKIGQKLKKPYERFDFSSVPVPPASIVSKASNKSSKISKSKDKKGKKNKKDNKKSKKDSKKDVKFEKITYKNQDTQIPEVEDDEDDETDKEPEEVMDIITPVAIQLPDKFQIMLIDIYEAVEQMVCSNLTAVVFQFNILHEDEENFMLNNIKMIKDYLLEPHPKQQHLEKFLIEFNALDDEYREDEEVKSEYFAKVNDLHKVLKAITDEYNTRRIDYMKEILLNDFTMKYLITHAHSHLSLLQIEINLQKHLLQILNDYYVGVITKKPCKNLLKSLKLKGFPEANYEDFKQYLIKCLYHEIVPDAENILNDYINGNCNLSLNLIKDYKTSCLRNVKDMEGLYKSKKVDEDLIEIFHQLIDEWKYLIEGTFVKCSLRIETITKQMIKMIKNLLNKFYWMSGKLIDLIRARYFNELFSIQLACTAIIDAVESEKRIQKRLLLMDDKFYVDPNVDMYLDDIPPVEQFYAPTSPYFFRIKDLFALIDVFKEVAPEGIIPNQCLTIMMGDIISYRTKICVPVNWTKLLTEELMFTMQLIFESNPYIDWRDFIIYNLNLPYPKLTDLLKAKVQFQRFDPDLKEFIPSYHMCNVKLWFDDSISPLVKALLCKLYETNIENVNYTILLLAFCKDHNPLIGFLNAIQVYIGALICVDVHEGDLYINKTYCQTDVVEADSNAIMNYEIKEFSDNFEYEEEDVNVFKIDNNYADSLVPIHVQLNEETTIDTKSDSTLAINLQTDSISVHGYHYHLYDEKLMEEEETNDFKKIMRELMSSDLLQYCELDENNEYKLRVVHSIPFEIFIQLINVILLKEEVSKEKTIRSEIKTIYKECKMPEYEDKVFTHHLFNNVLLKKIIERQYKFYQKNIRLILNSAMKYRESKSFY